VLFGAAVAAFSLLLGLGVLIAGLWSKRRHITIIGVLFLFAGVAYAVLVWGYCKLVDRDRMRGAAAPSDMRATQPRAALDAGRAFCYISGVIDPARVSAGRSTVRRQWVS